jgi:hypothetical protein
MDKVRFLTGIIVAGGMLENTLHKLYNNNNKANERLVVGVRGYL